MRKGKKKNGRTPSNKVDIKKLLQAVTKEDYEKTPYDIDESVVRKLLIKFIDKQWSCIRNKEFFEMFIESCGLQEKLEEYYKDELDEYFEEDPMAGCYDSYKKQKNSKENL